MTTVFTLVVDGESSLKTSGPLTVYDVMKAQEALEGLVYKATRSDKARKDLGTNQQIKQVPQNS